MKSMTKKEFQDGMNSILVDYESKEKVWSQLCEKQLQGERGFSLRKVFAGNKIGGKFSLWKAWTPVVVALLICVILVPGIVYADEIVNYFRGHLSQSPDLASNVNQGVFQDGNKHVSMEVCELLSDGYAACMTVKYTAFDKKGKEWLFGEIFQDVPPQYREEMHSFNLENVLHILPEKNENGTWASASYSTREIEQEQTKTSRVFSLEYNLDDEGSNRIRMTYPFYGKSKKKTLTVKNPLKTYTYALAGTGRTSNYTPKYLRLSKIKYIVFGENHGVYQKNGSNYTMLSDEEIDSAKLYLKNNSALDLIENAPGYSFMGAIDPDLSNYYMDLSVLSGEFYDQAEWIPYEDTENWYGDDTLQERIDHRMTVDPEDVQKIEINGDVFTLDRVD